MNNHEQTLEAIERRHRAASPGPWKSWVEGREFDGGSSVLETGSEPPIELGTRPATQDFIAHAWGDIVRLVEEIRRLQHGASTSEAETLTDFYLSDVEVRCCEALPGPWELHEVEGNDEFPFLIRTALPEGNRWRDMRPWGATMGDAEFIVHTRSDISWLLAEIYRLRGPQRGQPAS